MPFPDPRDHYIETVPGWGRQATAELSEMLLTDRVLEDRGLAAVPDRETEIERSVVWDLVGWIVAFTALITALTILAIDIRVVLLLWHP